MRRLLAAVGISLLAFVLVAGHGGDIAIASHTGGGGDCGGGWKNARRAEIRISLRAVKMIPTANASATSAAFGMGRRTRIIPRS